MALGGIANIVGTVFFNRALAAPGASATAITGLSACYPAVTMLLAAVMIGCVPSLVYLSATLCLCLQRNAHDA